MTDRVIIDSPFGMLAFSPKAIAEASAKANEMGVALVSPAQATETPSEPERWYSVEEVASMTGLKTSWLYSEVRNNRLPFRHFGKQVRIPASYLHVPDTESDAHQPGGQ